MIKLAVINEKGGVGKSFIASQFAFYCALLRGLKVLVVDLDQQCNTSKCLENSGNCTVSQTSSGTLLYSGKAVEEESSFLLIKGDKLLSRLESTGVENHNAIVTNFTCSLEKIRDKFDICIFDTNPSPDVRAVSALAFSDYALCPIQLNQEALDGVQQLFENIERVRAINPELKIAGLLPNQVVNTPFQKENFKMLVENFGELLLKTRAGRVVAVPQRTAIAEAQSDCRPVWSGTKSTAEKTWKEIRPVFDALADTIGLYVRR